MINDSPVKIGNKRVKKEDKETIVIPDSPVRKVKELIKRKFVISISQSVRVSTPVICDIRQKPYTLIIFFFKDLREDCKRCIQKVPKRFWMEQLWFVEFRRQPFERFGTLACLFARSALHPPSLFSEIP